jgi:hypothetical protein
MSLPHHVPHRSTVDDAPPEPRFDRHAGGETRYRSSALYVLDLLRGGNPVTLPEDLALAAVDAIEMRDIWRTMYLGAIERLGEAQGMITRQRETLTYLMGADAARAA